MAVNPLEESGAFKYAVSEMHTNDSAGERKHTAKIKVSALVRIKEISK